jgi:hypothetical protein
MKNKLKSLGLIIVLLMACSAISHEQSGPFTSQNQTGKNRTLHS